MNLVILPACFVAILSLHVASAFDSRDVLFVVVSQSEPYHAGVAERLKQDIVDQVLEAEQRQPQVLLSHSEVRVRGAWTVVPLLRPLLARGGDVRWVFFADPHSAVRCGALMKALADADEQPTTMWLGYPLTDKEPTIIHHFAYHDEASSDVGTFTYPHFASGFAMKIQLIEKLVKQIENGESHLDVDFSIDPAYELAQLVYGHKNRPGPPLVAHLDFCIIPSEDCITYPRQYTPCGSPIPEDSIFFAVKTWSGFHTTRARVVKRTWGKYVTHLMFFSDVADSSLPAIATGVANTKTGHCAKTLAILRYVSRIVRNMPQIRWIFLADDDTILGVKRLCEVLSCLRGGDEETVFGERYGYGYGKRETADKGYDYITGGGGTALSVAAAARLAGCACASPDAPDDMTLGACARFRLNITLTNSPLFHQARPQDYSREVLARDRPVSFHKHSTPGPEQVYGEWFHTDDLTLRRKHDSTEL